MGETIRSWPVDWTVDDRTSTIPAATMVCDTSDSCNGLFGVWFAVAVDESANLKSYQDHRHVIGYTRTRRPYHSLIHRWIFGREVDIYDHRWKST